MDLGGSNKLAKSDGSRIAIWCCQTFMPMIIGTIVKPLSQQLCWKCVTVSEACCECELGLGRMSGVAGKTHIKKFCM